MLPPAVAGLGLLVALGPGGFIGGLIEDAGVQLVFETAGVIVALTFVASPFYLRQAQAAFEALDPTLARGRADARRLGGDERSRGSRSRPRRPGWSPAGRWRGAGRSGEFGATLVFAGSFQGITQTAPLAIVELYGSDLTARWRSRRCWLAFSAALLAAVKLVSAGRGYGLVVD